MIPRPCIDCGVITARGSRCPTHTRAQKRQTRTTYSASERDRMRHAVRDHVARHGWLCMGYKRKAHWAPGQLTADHVLAVVDGGEGWVLRVLCRSCNSRRGGEQRARERDRDVIF
jgi:5-methylcytosine-specific restriction enzyme A